MKLKTFVTIVLAVALSGCTFNVDRERKSGRSEDNGDWRNQGWRADSRTPPGWITERQANNCPMYIPPDKRAVPGAPVDEFAKLRKGDYATREELLLKYIEQLRYHIKDVNTDNVDQYTKYLQACMGQSKQK